MAFRHASMLEEIHSILLLGEEQPTVVLGHRDAEEVVEVAKVRHGKF